MTLNEAKYEESLSQQQLEYEIEIQQVNKIHQSMYKNALFKNIFLKYKKDGSVQLSEERQNTAFTEGQLTAYKNKLDAIQKKMNEMKSASQACGNIKSRILKKYYYNLKLLK